MSASQILLDLLELAMLFHDLLQVRVLFGELLELRRIRHDLRCGKLCGHLLVPDIELVEFFCERKCSHI